MPGVLLSQWAILAPGFLLAFIMNILTLTMGMGAIIRLDLTVGTILTTEIGIFTVIHIERIELV